MSSPLPVSRAGVIRALDRQLIENGGVPDALLMEHAGHLVAQALLRRWGPQKTVVLCGPGNNGGDGYVIARHLKIAGAAVTARACFPPGTPSAALHHTIACRLGLVADADLGDATLIVDALFGTGQRAPLELPEIPGLDGARERGVPLVAVDVPTGIDADTGVRLGAFPDPDYIVTIGRLKPFLFTRSIPFELCDIGLARAGGPWSPSALSEAPEQRAEALWIDRLAVRPFAATDHKWSRGHVGVLAGSAEKAGAAVLVCLGALRGGAGLVTLHTPREAWARLGALPPEIMVEPVESIAGARADALVVGPGLGRVEDERVRRIWAEDRRPMLVDADGLRALDLRLAPGGPRGLTPHAGEAAALLGRPWAELETDRFATAAALGRIAPSLYKGVCPIIAGVGAPGEPGRWVLSGGVPTLGVGGSGDVLAGLIGALFARHRPSDAAGTTRCLLEGAWIHLEAGRRAGPPGVGAREIADQFPAVIAGAS